MNNVAPENVVMLLSRIQNTETLGELFDVLKAFKAIHGQDPLPHIKDAAKAHLKALNDENENNVSDDKYHWYCFVFKGSFSNCIGESNAFVKFKDKPSGFSKAQLACLLGQTDLTKGILVNIFYVGHMTEDEYYGQS